MPQQKFDLITSRRISRNAPKQPRMIELLLALEIIVLDEMHLGAETHDHSPFLVPVAYSLVLSRILARVKTSVGAVGAAKILNIRFPHRIRGWIEVGKLVGLWTVTEPTDRAVLNIAGKPRR